MAITSLLIILIVLAVLLVLGVPITYAIGISALAAIVQLIPLDISVFTGAQRTFVGVSILSLTAIPFFVMAGNLMNTGGIAKRLVNFVLAFLGKVPGSLMVTNVGASALFGAISGSGSAAAAAVGSMVKEGEDDLDYDPALCAATNVAAAPSGLIIPPLQHHHYLLPGLRRHLGGCPLPGWLPSRSALGPGLHGSGCVHGQAQGLHRPARCL